MNMLNDDLFGQTYDQLTSKAFGAASQNFQMIASPIAFSFLTAGVGQMDPGIYQIVSQMPVWSPLGTFGTNGTTLFSAYRQLLANVTFKVDPGKQADLSAQQSQINDYQRQLTQAQADMTQAYNVAKNNGGPVFAAQYPDIPTWLAGPGSTYTKTISTLTSTINQLIDKYTNDLAAMQGDQSLNASLQAASAPTAAPSSGTSKPGWILVPDSGGTLQWQPEFVLNKSPSVVRQDLAQGSVGGFTLTLSSATSSSSMKRSWAGGNASYGNPFFSVNGGGGWEQLNIDDSDKSVQVQISAKSSTLDLVSPGVWYNAGFLKNLAQNQGASGYQLAAGWSVTGSKNAAFGQSGLVSTLVAGLALVYQPSVTVTMSESTMQRNKQKITANAGLRIGPFTFGGSGGSQSDTQITMGGTTSFTATSTSTDPLIIGVSVGFPGGVGPS